MDNNDREKTVIVEKDTPERSTSPLGVVIGIIVLLALAILALNLFANNGDTQETNTDTDAGTETTVPAPQGTTPQPTE